MTLPLYEANRCVFLHPSANCGASGRPNVDYMYLRWQPAECDLPKFEARAFLEAMRNKRLLMVGDSLARNMMESLLCLLTAPSSAGDTEEVRGDISSIGKSESHTNFFPYYNATLEYERSEHLMSIEEVNEERRILLDANPWYISGTYDVIVLNSCHHWTASKWRSGTWVPYLRGTRRPDMSMEKAYEIGMKKVVDSLNNPTLFGGTAFFRTCSPSHSIGGAWNAGGHCDVVKPLDEIPTDENPLDVIVKGAIEDAQRRLGDRNRVKLLDIARLSLYRADGHPGAYHPPNGSGARDCSHWCLPGVPDTWNQLLFAQSI